MIVIQKLGNNLYKSEPIDRYGNYENTESRQRDANNLPIEKPEFVAVDSKIRKQTDALTGKEVVEFFKYYPELRRMIKDENIQRTLLELTALSITNDLKKTDTVLLIVCGGGAKNKFMMKQ